MPAPEQMLDLYLHLACAAEAEARPLTRDKFLILAAGVAQTAGYSGIAEDCRLRVLEHNPNHMLKYFGSVREALRSSEIRHYVRQLFRLYPFEKAEFLLAQYRASGYAGHHGYVGLAEESEPPSPRPGKRRSRRRRSRSNEKSGLRPSLRKAFARLERAKQKEKDKLQTPLAHPDAIDRSFELEALTQPSFDRARFWSVIILAFSVGTLVGGLAIATLFPTY